RRGAAHALGRESKAWGANATLRFYQRPIPSYWRLVLGLRLLADVASDGNPFYRAFNTGGISSEGDLSGPDGLGGRSSIRALPLRRFPGNAEPLAHAGRPC